MATAAALPRSLTTRPRTQPSTEVLLAAGAFAGSIALLLHGGFFVSHPRSGHLDAAGVILVALSTLPVLASRRSAIGAFVVAGVANVVLAAVVYPIGVPLGPAVALYLLAASRNEVSPRIGRITLTVLLLLVAYLAAATYAEATFPGFEVLHAGLLWSVAWFAGERSRLRREQIAELKRDAQRERLLAAAEERARIARDLHDSAGHAINVIAVRAGAARLRHPNDPDQSLVALQAIEDLARRTAADIDRFVGVLRARDDSDRVESPPGLASFPTLIAQHRGAGLDVEYATSGTPRPLATAVDQGAYRILQEALTNASRHGTGAARVDVVFGDAALQLSVTNPTAAPQTARPDGAGHGLVGMHERTALLGGDLDVDQDGSTFCIRSRLQYDTDRA